MWRKAHTIKMSESTMSIRPTRKSRLPDMRVTLRVSLKMRGLAIGPRGLLIQSRSRSNMPRQDLRRVVSRKDIEMNHITRRNMVSRQNVPMNTMSNMEQRHIIRKKCLGKRKLIFLARNTMLRDTMKSSQWRRRVIRSLSM